MNRVLLMLLVLTGLSGCGQPSDAVSQPQPVESTDEMPADAAAPTANGPDSHDRMLAELRRIATDEVPKLPYLGDGQRDRLLQLLERMPPGAPAEAELQLRLKLADAQLRLGETQQSIDQLLECWNKLPVFRKQVPNSAQLHVHLMLKLSVAYLRLAENQNCVHCLDEDCCIFPLQGGGIHRQQEPARQAVRYLTELLNEVPDDNTATWLINVAYMTLGEHPDKVPEAWLLPQERLTKDETFPRFKNIAPDLGLDVFSLSGGMIVDDFNGDDWLDVVASSWDPAVQMKCWLNNGDGTFTENSEQAGLTGICGGLNLIQADYDNDGDLDILVLRGAWLRDLGQHPNSLLRNDGHARFRDVTFEVGLGERHYPTQTAAWADYDNDGDLDLYVGNELGESELFENDGSGHFTNVAANAGVVGGGYPKAVIWGDYDDDRYPDLYVSNLMGPNQLFHNNRDGTFTDVAATAGVAKPERSFPAWFWDVDNDGALDLFVGAYWTPVQNFAADYLDRPHPAETDRLFRGDGQGGFQDVSEEMGVDSVTLPMGSNFGDIDNDGFLDYYLGTGYPEYAGIMPNRAFHNRRGQGFTEVTASAGLGHLQKGHGVAFADYDHDGDQDIFIEMGGAFPGDGFSNAVFRNPGFGHHWIVVRLNGTTSNRFGIGSRIRVDVTEGGQQRSIYKWVNSGGTFGGSPLRQHIGLGMAETIDRLEIYWPASNTTQTFTQLSVDQMVIITEGDEDCRTERLEPAVTF